MKNKPLDTGTNLLSPAQIAKPTGRLVLNGIDEFDCFEVEWCFRCIKRDRDGVGCEILERAFQAHKAGLPLPWEWRGEPELDHTACDAFEYGEDLG